MSEFDFTAVTVEESAMPKASAGKKPAYENNPFAPWIVDSWEARKTDPDKCGRAITVPKAQVQKAVYLIRRAAGDMKIGVTVVCTLPKSIEKLTKEDLEKFNDSKHITIRFCAKEKRNYTGRRKNGEKQVESVTSIAEEASTSEDTSQTAK